MKRIAIILAVAVIVSLLGASVAVAGPGNPTGNDMVSGPHYNLNIIGVPKDKTVPSMTNSNRNTVFVPLQNGGDVPRQVKIYYVPGTEFKVLDGNATDDNEATIMVPADPCGTLSYDVYARGLGKPWGSAHVDAEVTFEDNTVGYLLDDDFDVSRLTGKPKTENITSVFLASGTIYTDDTLETVLTTFNRVWVFNVPTLLEYFWDYDNDGLKVMQVRFYGPTESGSWTNAEACRSLLD